MIFVLVCVAGTKNLCFILQLPRDPTTKEVRIANNIDVLRELIRRLMLDRVALMLNSVADSDVDLDNHHHNKLLNNVMYEVKSTK